MPPTRLSFWSVLALAAFAPEAAQAQATFTFSIPNDTVVTGNAINVTVQSCDIAGSFRSETGTLVNSAGSTNVFMSDGPVPNCGGGGYAWIVALPLEYGANKLVVAIVDWNWVTQSYCLKVWK